MEAEKSTHNQNSQMQSKKNIHAQLTVADNI